METSQDSTTRPKTSQNRNNEKFAKNLQSLSAEILQSSPVITTEFELIQALERHDLYLSSNNVQYIGEHLVQTGRADLASILLGYQPITTTPSAQLPNVQFPSSSGISQKACPESTFPSKVLPDQFPQGLSQGGGQGSTTNIGILHVDGMYAPHMQAFGNVISGRDHMTIQPSGHPLVAPNVAPANLPHQSKRNLLSDISQILSNLKTLYKRHYSRVNPFPWLRESVADLKEHFCTLHLVTREARRQMRQSKTDASIPKLLSKLRDFTPLKHCDIFTADKDGEPRRILIEGEPGIGKTSLCIKLATDWSQGEVYIAKKFEGVFFIRARNVKTSIRDYLHKTLLMTQSDVEQVWKCMLDPQYQNRFLFIIDGLDEVVVDSLPIEFVDLIEGRLFFNSCVLVTSRTNQWQSKLPATTESSFDFDSQLFDREIVNVGFTQETAFEFIDTVGTVKQAESQIETLQQFIGQYEFLEDLIRSPLVCIFLCIMWNENYIIPGLEETVVRRTILYANMVECLVKRFCQQTQEPCYKLVNGELSSATREKLGQVYKVAYCALKEGKVQISLGDVKRYLEIDDLNENDVMFSLGILVKETDLLGFDGEIVFAFPHRTVQEELSSEYYVVGMSEEERVRAAQQIVDSFPLMCIFSSGLVFHRNNLDPALLVPLFHEMANRFDNRQRVNTFSIFSIFGQIPKIVQTSWMLDSSVVDESFMDILKALRIAIESVFECGYKTLLTNIIAEKLPKTIYLSMANTNVYCGILKCLNDSKAHVESVTIEFANNIFVKELPPPVINIVGLASVFKNNKVLSKLHLSGSILKLIVEKKGGIVKTTDQNTEWEALGEALMANTALKDLELRACEIPDRGWEALGEALKDNKALTKLNLSECKIPDRGWEALGEAIKANKALTQLALFGCGIHDRGCEALGEAIKVNTVMAKLDLSGEKITERRLRALDEALAVNNSLTELNLSRIADETLKANKCLNLWTNRVTARINLAPL